MKDETKKQINLFTEQTKEFIDTTFIDINCPGFGDHTIECIEIEKHRDKLLKAIKEVE